ncbi:MAG: hypothetical protein IBJ11_09520 [Phycisphaerales bacterium]|nr:hypothetical protein [Phycisphaerales bacterium]
MIATTADSNSAAVILRLFPGAAEGPAADARERVEVALPPVRTRSPRG